MRIAIPVSAGKLAAHFGHCEQFALIDVDPEQRSITEQVLLAAPPHQPGLLPAWLADRGATVIIAGGMGHRAQTLFAQKSIDVVIGAPAVAPEQVVAKYLTGSLQTGENLCDH